MVEIPQNQIKIMPKNLPNIGVCETQLPRNVIDNFWDLIEEAKKTPQDMKSELAGNIKSSLLLDVQSSLLKDFYSYVLPPLIETHLKSFGSPWRANFNPEVDKLNLFKLWVNFQKQHEFSPMHDHNGIYSFVIWMKIPTSYEEQRQLPIAKKSNSDSQISNFGFIYQDILGNIKNYYYNMEKDIEGYLVLFPSKLLHLVNPFFDCEDERITISGNIGLT